MDSRLHTQNVDPVLIYSEIHRQLFSQRLIRTLCCRVIWIYVFQQIASQKRSMPTHFFLCLPSTSINHHILVGARSKSFSDWFMHVKHMYVMKLDVASTKLKPKFDTSNSNYWYVKIISKHTLVHIKLMKFTNTC